MASSMSSRSDRSDGSLAFPMREMALRGWSSHEDKPPCLQRKDAKDAVTYQSWRWDLLVYQCVGCRDHTLLPYAISIFARLPW